MSIGMDSQGERRGRGARSPVCAGRQLGSMSVGGMVVCLDGIGDFLHRMARSLPKAGSRSQGMRVGITARLKYKTPDHRLYASVARGRSGRLRAFGNYLLPFAGGAGAVIIGRASLNDDQGGHEFIVEAWRRTVRYLDRHLRTGNLGDRAHYVAHVRVADLGRVARRSLGLADGDLDDIADTHAGQIDLVAGQPTFLGRVTLHLVQLGVAELLGVALVVELAR